MRIEAQNLSVTYGAQNVLHDVSLTIRTGEFVGLIGPNGAGKSTLLRALAGLQPISSGVVKWDGKDQHHIARAERARHVSYLAQKQNADWPLCADDVVMLGRLPHRSAFGVETEADRRAVDQALQSVGMIGYRERALDELSGGERARILLARALAVEAPLLFADEPVAALDPLYQLKTMDLLRARVNAGDGVVAVLHDLSLAMRYCDRIVLLDHGQIRIDGRLGSLSDAIIAEVYGIDVFRAFHHDQAIVMPWRVRDEKVVTTR